MAKSYHEPNPSQEERILQLLRDAGGRWVSLPEILALRISQYSARIFGLRRKGYIIENRGERVDGQLHTWFRLVSEPPLPYSCELNRSHEKQISQLVTAAVDRDDSLQSLFGDISPVARHRDDN